MQAHGESDESGLAGEITQWGHRLKARVYFADTDFSGVVYHARYLEFFERGRSDYLRLAGIHHAQLADGQHGKKLVWVVRRMEIDFLMPAIIDDILTIDTWTRKISGARIFMAQRICKESTILVQASVEAAVIDERGRPQRFPIAWRDSFRASQGPV